MNTIRIEELIVKYFEGETTLHEEQELRQYFSGQEIPAHLHEHIQMFSSLEAERRLAFNDPDFEAKLTAKLMAMDPEPKSITMIPRNRRQISSVMGIAAGVLLIAGLFFIFRSDLVKSPSVNDELAFNTDVAYTDVSEALYMFSGNFNYALKHMEKLESVELAMKELEIFSKFYQYQTIIINPDDRTAASLK